jgi:hypothetical protein
VVVLETHSNLVVYAVSRSAVLQQRYCVRWREVFEVGQVGHEGIVNRKQLKSGHPQAGPLRSSDS